MKELFDKVRQFVVGIKSQSYLTTLGTDSPATINFAENTIIYERVGTGTIMLGGRIECPSELVLIPPLELANRNRYPFVSDVVPPPTGVVPDEIVIASRITVTIEIPRRCGCCEDACREFSHSCKSCKLIPYEYLARVLVVDGAGNQAILEIDDLNSFNGTRDEFNPLVSKDGLVLGSKPKDGDEVYVIGYTNSNNRSFGDVEVKSINPATVSKSYYMDPSGWVLPQLTLLSVAGVYNNQVGSPIIDRCGRLIGMVITAPTGTVVSDLISEPIANNANSTYVEAGLPHTTTSGEGRVAAIHVSELRQFLRALRYDQCSGSLETSNTSFIPVNDNYHGTYSRYVRAYLGIGYRQFKGSDYVDNIDFTGLITGNPGFEYPLDLTGLIPTTNPKVLSGIIVTSVAGSSIASLPSHLTPGNTEAGIDGFPVIIADSPLLNMTVPIAPGDRILSFQVNNSYFEVGGQDCERAPNLFLSRVVPGEVITIEYIKANTIPKFNYQSSIRDEVTVQSYPAFLDFPYSAGHRYPYYLTVFPPSYPGFEPSI